MIVVGGGSANSDIYMNVYICDNNVFRDRR